MQHIMQVLVAASRLVHGIRWNPSSFLPPCVCQGGTLTISITPEVVVILAFTLYLDLGSTVNSAWTGFYGTLLPVLNCWLMFSLYPDGVPWRQGGNQDGKEKQLLSLRMEPWARWGEAWRYIQQDLWLGGFLCFCAADVCLGFCHQCQDVCTVTWQAWSFSFYIVCRSISPSFGQLAACLGSWDHLRAVRHPWSELHIWLITVQHGAISMGLAKMLGNQKAALYAEGLRGVKAMQRMKLLHIHMPAPLVSRIPNNYLRTPSKIRNKYRYVSDIIWLISHWKGSKCAPLSSRASAKFQKPLRSGVLRLFESFWYNRF